LKHLKANIDKGVRFNGEGMESTTSLWLFNLFIVGMFGWFYFYFHSMFNAVADLNDELISIINGKKPQEDEGQTALTDFFPEEE
jgi:hypothetical protein